jgi:allantoicase
MQLSQTCTDEGYVTDFTDFVDLAAERLGGAVLAANDEFFAPKEALLRPTAPEWREGVYTEDGKWMDGWETRRRRDPGHDWCIVRLGLRGRIRGVVVDTSFFRGNYPEACSIEACEWREPGVPDEASVAWTEILPRSPLQGDTANRFEVRSEGRFTHLRLNIFPDGGVARLRVHGEAAPEWPKSVHRGGEMDLAALENGGWVATCSDRFYGHPQNLILPGRSLFMGDGWETRRRRGPGHDWTIVRLAAPGRIHRVELDTDYFRGNAPDRCVLEAAYAPGAEPEELDGVAWTPLVAEQKLHPHARHRWEDEVRDAGPVTHVRLSIFPDGGVARLRIFGTLAEPGS